MFQVEYLWNAWVKKNGVNTNQVLFDLPNVRYPHWFCFSACLSIGQKNAQILESDCRKPQKSVNFSLPEQ